VLPVASTATVHPMYWFKLTVLAIFDGKNWMHSIPKILNVQGSQRCRQQ